MEKRRKNVFELIRLCVGLEAKELADQLSVSPQYISMIENGKKTPSLKLINAYSDILGVKPSTVLKYCEMEDSLDYQQLLYRLLKSAVEN